MGDLIPKMIDDTTAIKLVVVGDTDVGKTSLVLRYANGTFDEGSTPTIGAACVEKKVSFDGKEYFLSMWDTAGQETYRNLVPMYFRNAQLAFIVIDVTNPLSANNVDYWINSIYENCMPNTPVILVANKIDVPERKIDHMSVSEVADQNKVPFVETSAKTGFGITKLFELAFSLLVGNTVVNDPNEVSLTTPIPKKDQKKDGCC